jgi:hypothetical protein
MRVAELADSHYRRQWLTCSTEEHVLLLQLAQGKLISAKDPALLQHLLSRGLIRRAPDLQLCSQSFGAFVLGAERRKTIVAIRAEAAESSWSSVRTPVFAALVVAGGFVLIAGGEAVRSTLALFSGLAATVPALLQLLN